MFIAPEALMWKILLTHLLMVFFFFLFFFSPTGNNFSRSALETDARKPVTLLPVSKWKWLFKKEEGKHNHNYRSSPTVA